MQGRRDRAHDLFGRARIHQRTEQHIAAGTAYTIDIRQAHHILLQQARDFVSPYDFRHACLTLICAHTAAPNPLSMLTTDTPGAHEFNIASSAARPLKLTP